MSLEQVTQPAALALTATRGDSIERVFRLIDVATSAPIPLTGWSGFAAVYPASGVASILLSFTVVVSQDAAGQPETGLVTMTAAGGDTLLMPSTGVWQLVLELGAARKTIVAGQWCLLEPFAGQPYASECATSPSGALGSCGYSETLGMTIPSGAACDPGLSAPAPGTIDIVIGTVASCGC